MTDTLSELDATGLLAAASEAVRERRLAEVHDLEVQTGSHNSGPLGRRHHRWKTHAGHRARQCGQGRYVWLSPHGLAFIVDHRGTRRIDPHHAREILEAPPGVDLYFT